MIDLICVGSARGALREASSDYEGRLARMCRFRLREVRDERLDQTTAAEALERERRRIEPMLVGARVVALDRRGRQLASEELAAFVREREELPPQHTAFVIGGPRGLSPDLLERSDLRLSLGAPTLPHQLARVVLLEQLYRAFTIIRGEPYHL
jgi:23S rRNA (pseudouridine1915-N3)-methyltransferase